MALLPSAVSFPSAQNFYSPTFGQNQISAMRLKQTATQNIYRTDQLEKQKYLFEQMMKTRTLQERRHPEMGRSAEQTQFLPVVVVQQDGDHDDDDDDDDNDDDDDDGDDGEETSPIEHVAEVGVISYGFTTLDEDDWGNFALTELFNGGLVKFNIPSVVRLQLLLAMSYIICNVQYVTASKPRRYRNDFCRQPLRVGTGHESHRAYFYDSTRDKCIEFRYSGRGGNRNRFEKKRECQLRCRTFSPEGKEQFDLIVRQNLYLESMDFLLEEMNMKSFIRCLWNIRMTKIFADLDGRTT